MNKNLLSQFLLVIYSENHLTDQGVYILFLCIFKKIFCTWIGLYTDRSELTSCIVRDSATKLLFIGATLNQLHYPASSTQQGRGMWAGSLASIRAKTWPWGARHFATLEVNARQMPRYVPAGGGCGGLHWLVHYCLFLDNACKILSGLFQLGYCPKL